MTDFPCPSCGSYNDMHHYDCPENPIIETRLRNPSHDSQTSKPMVLQEEQKMQKPCIVFDIDGTLAIGDHRIHHIQKSPKDWESYFAECYDDELNWPIAAICRALGQHYRIVYVTGRTADTVPTTKAWLDKHALPQGPIYFRPQNDRRDDQILKLELLDEVTRNGFRILVIFDDRDRVVHAAREAGYTVAQVAKGDF